MSENIRYVLISLLTIAVFVLLFVFRSIDDNRLTSWQWVFDINNAPKIYLALLAAIAASYFMCKISLPERYNVGFLFVFSFLVSVFFYKEPEVIVDSSRYFTQAKHMKMFGVGYFLQEWGRGISAWTDMPFVPFLYGLIFKFFGESRVYIQLFNTMLFSMTIVLTYFIGKTLWDESVGFYAGMLMLGIPYLFSQVPLMLVDVPSMFFLILAVFAFIKVLDRGSLWIIFSALAIFAAFFSKYSAWMMLSVLIVILFVYMFQHITPDSKPRTLYLYRGLTALAVSALLITVVLWYKFDVFSEQIRFLIDYQKPGLRRWGESFASTFLFQIHPFITIAALYSVYAAFKKKDLKYLIVVWLPALVVLMQIRRIRYIIMAFPMLALAASYGMQRIKDRNVKRFVVSCIVSFSIVVAGFAYLPFMLKMSVVNLKDAGEFLNSLDIKTAEVITLPAADSPVNPAVSAPLIDLFTSKKILYHYEPLTFPNIEIEKSPLRFTWEYKNPGYYEEQADADALVVISGGLEIDVPFHIKERIKRYSSFRAFHSSDDIFRHQTLVTIYYNTRSKP